MHEWMNEWMNESFEWYLVEFHFIYVYLCLLHILRGQKQERNLQTCMNSLWISHETIEHGPFSFRIYCCWAVSLHPPWSQMDAQWPQTPTFTQIQRTQASGRWTPLRKRITPLKTDSSPLKIDGWKMTCSFQNGPSSGFSGGKQLMRFFSKPACSRWWHMVSFLQHNVDFLLDTLANIQLVRYHNKISNRLIHTQGRRRRETRSQSKPLALFTADKLCSKWRFPVMYCPVDDWIHGSNNFRVVWFCI